MTQSREHLDYEDGRSKKSSSSNKMQSCILVVLTTALLVATITLGVLYGQEKGKTGDTSTDVCESAGCIKAANRILSSMNQSVNPCEDFYEFSCGMWVQDHLIPESKSSVNVFNDVRDAVSQSLKTVLEMPSEVGEHTSITKAKNFYASCMGVEKINELGIAPVQTLIATMGGWPIVDSSTPDSSKSIERRVAEFNTLYGTGAILYSYVGADSKDSNHNVLQITEPSLGLPDRDYYLDGNTSATAVPAYKDYIINFAKAMGASDDAATQKLADDIVDFETALASRTLTNTESRDETQIYSKKSLAAVGSDVSGAFDWTEYVSVTMEVADRPDVVIVDDTEVVMYASKYGATFMEVLNDPAYDVTFMQNYLVWRVMKARHSYMPQVLRDARAEYDKQVSGVTAEDSRWKTCADEAEAYFPMPAGSLFVEAYFPAENKKATETMVEQIRQSFKDNLNDIDWMDADTKKQAEIKADAIREMIAYPDYIVNDKNKMDVSYNSLTVDSETFFENAQSLQVFGAQYSYSKYDTTVDKDEWISGPAIVNAFYSPSRNQIFFPAGILQPPFYDQYQPTAMNYGGIGMVIGHEITHGFDDSGSNYDGQGNLVDWWSAASRQGFDREAAKMSQQYSNEFWDDAEAYLNGDLTLGENIADNGGIREAFLALKKWQQSDNRQTVTLPGMKDFTEEQLFFLGFSQVWCGKYTKARAVQLQKTDPHSPGKFRVKIPGFNFEEFGKAYNCIQGRDVMYPNPEDTVRVW